MVHSYNTKRWSILLAFARCRALSFLNLLDYFRELTKYISIDKYCDFFFNLMQFKMAQEYFKSAQGGLLVDVSCGSGLFSRKFAKSGTYSGVVALDFSENMLRQCYDFIKQDNTILTS